MNMNIKRPLIILALTLAFVTSVFGTDAWFSWTPNPSYELVSSYRLEYQKLPAVTNWNLLTTVQATTNTVVVTGLQTGYIYKFRMFAINGVGTSTNTSNVIQLPTNAPSVVVNFQQISAP